MGNRFDQLYDLLDSRKPKVILETGTWNAGNAIRMVREAKASRYIGFDIWDDGSEELDKLEYNAKKRCAKAEAHTALETYQKDFTEFDFELVKGNTRDTMPDRLSGEKRFVDFAFIDGGHSVGTIQSDLNIVLTVMNTDGFIIVDDYYYDVTEPTVGANNALLQFRHPYTVLPIVEGVRGGGYVKMVLIEMTDVPTMEFIEGAPTETWTFAA